MPFGQEPGGVGHVCTAVPGARGGLRRQHDRCEAIVATAEGGIIQDDLLPTPEYANRCLEFLRTPARQFGQLLG
jgi:hypothetical protein